VSFQVVAACIYLACGVVLLFLGGVILREDSRSQVNRTTAFMLVFAGLALALAAIGIFGVISYSVSQRTHEIGIRVALGAKKRDVLRLVVGRGVVLTLVGVTIGAGAALGLTHFLAGMLYGVRPTDPVTYLLACLLLTGVALLASYLPVRRATRVDPMVALRYE